MKKFSTLFGGSKTSGGVVENTLKHMAQLNDTNKRNSALEKLSEDLSTLQLMLYGDPDNEPNAEEVKKLVPLILESDKQGYNLFYKLCEHIKDLSFEAKKQAAQIICFVVRRCNKNDLPEYLQNHTNVFQTLMEGFEDTQLAQHVGSVLQEMAKRSEIGIMLFDIQCDSKKPSSTIIFKPVAISKSASLFMDREAITKTITEDESKDEVTDEEKIKNDGSPLEVLIHSNDSGDVTLTVKDVVTQLFVYSHYPNLIIAGAAFEVLTILLNKHENRSRQYIEKNFEEVMKYFNGSVMSENFVTQGKFLKLLGDILLSKHNNKIRMQYIAEKENLRVVMTLLKSSHRLIGYESFHIFKVFVSNPNKSEEVHIILFKNRDKLIKLLEEFQIQREESDPEFKQEKGIVLEHLRTLEKPPKVSSQEKKTRKEEEEATDSNR